jgi:hypothetical protein
MIAQMGSFRTIGMIPHEGDIAKSMDPLHRVCFKIQRISFSVKLGLQQSQEKSALYVMPGLTRHPGWLKLGIPARGPG